MPSLRIHVPGKSPAVYHLYKALTSLGSSPECDVVLPDPLIAESFAHIHFDGQTYTLTTLARQNEAVINGKKRKKHRLSHQDKLVIGSVEMQFCLLDEPVVTDVKVDGAVAELRAYQKLYDFSARLLEKHDLGVLVHRILSRNTLKDFLYRQGLKTGEDEALQSNPRFWELIQTARTVGKH